MIKLILIFLIPFTLNASKILSYNIYDRTDRADVMLSFDTPYNGVIKQSTSKSKIVIKLMSAQIESTKLKKLSSAYLYSLSITPMAGYTQIIASVPDSIRLKASKTADAYGLRLRFISRVATKAKEKKSTIKNPNPLSNLPTKQEDGEMSKNYYIVIVTLIIGILILLFVKKKILKNGQNPKSSWAFTDNHSNQQAATQEALQNNASIRFQKSIDTDNSVVMLDFADQSYLIFMGKTNILLDKFRDNKPQTQEDFETILQSKHQELDNFLRVEPDNNHFINESKNGFDRYKESADNLNY